MKRNEEGHRSVVKPEKVSTALTHWITTYELMSIISTKFILGLLFTKICK